MSGAGRPAVTRIELVAAPDDTHRAAIGEPLRAFNEGRLGARDALARTLALALREADDGPITGGLWGHIYFEWLFVELLYVPPALRGQGVGRTLLGKAEDEARASSCGGVWLDTFSFQAQGFYEKQGYRVFGRLDHYPGTHTRFFLSKRLDSGTG